MECVDISSFCVQLASKCVSSAHSEHHFHLDSSFYHRFSRHIISRISPLLESLQTLQGPQHYLHNNTSPLCITKNKSWKDLHVIQRQIIELTDIDKLCQQNFDALTDKINCLQNKKNKLEQFVLRFRNGNKKYPAALNRTRRIINFSPLAVVEALRLNLDRYAIIYNNKYDNNDSGSSTAVVEVPYSSCFSSSSPYPKPYQNYYYNEYHEGILEIAKTFFNGLLNQIVDKTMVGAVKENV